MSTPDRRLLVPACLIPLFKTGPLAWNGILSFWIPVAVFVAWFAVMFWAIRAAVLRSSPIMEGNTVGAS